MDTHALRLTTVETGRCAEPLAFTCAQVCWRRVPDDATAESYMRSEANWRLLGFADEPDVLCLSLDARNDAWRRSESKKRPKITLAHRYNFVARISPMKPCPLYCLYFGNETDRRREHHSLRLAINALIFSICSSERTCSIIASALVMFHFAKLAQPRNFSAASS